jgi:hypothetical protein
VKSPTLLRHVSGTVVAATFITYFLFVHHVARPTFAQNVGNTKQLCLSRLLRANSKAEKHTPITKLRRGDFLRVVLEQHDIDLIVPLRNRAGVELVETNLFGECSPESSTCASSPGSVTITTCAFFTACGCSLLSKRLTLS